MQAPLKIALVSPKSQSGIASIAAGAMVDAFGEIETLDSQAERQRLRLEVKAQRRYPDWLKEISHRSGREIFHRQGIFIISNNGGEHDVPKMNLMREQMSAYGEEFEEVDPKDIPGLKPNYLFRAQEAMLMKGGLSVDTTELLPALEEAAKKSDRYTRIDDCVTSVEPEGSTWKVKTSKSDTLLAEKVIICAGAQSFKILGEPLRVKAALPKLYFGRGASVTVINGPDVPYCVDTPVAKLYPEYGVEKMPEVDFFCPPLSLFALLPIVLQYGYKHIVVGYERSADASNLIWDKTGEEINHQWFKSTQSDRLLRNYINEELIGDLNYFSLLRPIYDTVIFGLLDKDSNALKDTHSCNIGKPWCERCAKCAYVYLACMAYLPEEQVKSTFQNNLFDLPENQIWYRELLGLEKHKAFECVGEIEEVRLAFEICRRKGLKGKALKMFEEEVQQDYRAIAEKYTDVNSDCSEIPNVIAEKILPQMQEAARSSQKFIFGLLQ